MTFSGRPPMKTVRQPRGFSRVVGAGAMRLGGARVTCLHLRGFFTGTVRPSGDIWYPNIPIVMRKSPL